jgi:[ribosomal protein S5]-alanine N-acetyltransferase
MLTPTYQTKRLEIRALRLTDYQCWYDSHDLAKPKVDKFDMQPWPKRKRTRAIFRKAVLRHRKLAKVDKVYVWNIFLRATGEQIGHLDIAVIQRDTYKMANLGYFLLNTYRGNGYAVEALRKIIPAAFEDLKLHRLEAAIDLDNKASIQLARACGLYREGIKKHYWFQNGRWEDQVVYIATPELWKKRR